MAQPPFSPSKRKDWSCPKNPTSSTSSPTTWDTAIWDATIPAAKFPRRTSTASPPKGCALPTPMPPPASARPSRYALLTGRYCWRTPLKSSVLWPWDPPLIEAERPTVAKLLRQQGYRTACIGKWHLGWEWATKDGRPACGDAPIGFLDREQRQALERNIDYSKPMGGGPLACGFDYYFGVDVPNFPPYTWFEQDRLAGDPTEQSRRRCSVCRGL